MTDWNKMDDSLSSIYLDYLHEREHGSARAPRLHSHVPKDGKLNLALQYTGDLDEIAALGLEVTSRTTAGRAMVSIPLAILETIVSHPGVLRLSYGRPPRPYLDVSAPDVNVRDQIWTVQGGVFNGATGAGVIIGIIDTGIDFKHPFFREQANTTRIIRIWDQGLAFGAVDQQPPPARLLENPTGPTYGVEYDEGMIRAAVQGTSTRVLHRDCHGHGTHVASIAAGDGRDDYKFVGIAPHAKLVVVKYLSLDNDPLIPDGQLFRDAVCYILNTARDLDMPVVINASFGDDTTAHDGLSDGEVFLTNKFAGAVGQVFVQAAGNSGGTFATIKSLSLRPKQNQHARLEFPIGGGSGEIPFELTDERISHIEFNHCKPKDETGDLSFYVYYPFGKTVTFEVQLPGTTAFIAAPALGGSPEARVFERRGMRWRHATESQPIGGTIYRRNVFQFTQIPWQFQHLSGIYTLRISTHDQMTAHVYCSHYRGTFRVDDSAPLPSFVHLEDRFLIGKHAGAANILTVASYIPGQGRPVAESSSRGPLATYGGPQPPEKPDLAAPGEEIDAALSGYSHDAALSPKNTTPMSGTSIAAPHVTGAAALLLSKNKLLTTADIIAKLKTNVRTDPSDIKEEVGAGRLDARKAFDQVP